MWLTATVTPKIGSIVKKSKIGCIHLYIYTKICTHLHKYIQVQYYNNQTSSLCTTSGPKEILFDRETTLVGNVQLSKLVTCSVAIAQYQVCMISWASNMCNYNNISECVLIAMQTEHIGIDHVPCLTKPEDFQKHYLWNYTSCLGFWLCL